MVAGRKEQDQKFTEMVVYVADRLRSDPRGGAVKLNKALHYSELRHMRRTGHPITDTEYQKLPWGPAPRQLLPVREQLLDCGDAELVRDAEGQDRLLPKRKADLSLFDPEELESINVVVDWLMGRSAAEVSNMSHREMGWFLAEEGDTIIPEMAYLRPAVLRPEVRAHARRLSEQRRKS